MSDSILLKAMVPVELASKFMQLIFFFPSVCLMLGKSAIYFPGYLSEPGEMRWMDTAGEGAVVGAGVSSRTCCSAHEIFSVPQVAL